MKRKILKLFLVYSYVTLLMYVASEEWVSAARYVKAKKNGSAGTIKFESLWKTTFKRLKTCWTMLDE